jgi:hypothetical protein
MNSNADVISILLKQKHINESNLQSIKKIYQDLDNRYTQLNNFIENQVLREYNNPNAIQNVGSFFPDTVYPTNVDPSSNLKFRQISKEPIQVMQNGNINLLNQSFLRNIDTQRNKELNELKLQLKSSITTTIPPTFFTTPVIESTISTTTPTTPITTTPTTYQPTTTFAPIETTSTPMATYLPN